MYEKVQSVDSVKDQFCYWCGGAAQKLIYLAVELIKIAPVVVNAEINGVPLDTDSITNMDAFDSTWQSTFSKPKFIKYWHGFCTEKCWKEYRNQRIGK